ncbi:glycosyltransferase family 2 protein [Pedobacter sp. GR22-10]|uniref:glycosyltransferase family 2 protein n=1 Tax=Pedobacter sp. GR22-10 TaxID=2994472 RepID=UPI00224840D7|nr:glycosyltransferase family 2 protein [Pedobacter sp. GR22-10]MCX2432818.1 glycosyltransferase family 2 protein [Pedobacter sp. GR22-10]
MTHAVIIPLFNKAAYIAQTLQSLLRQHKLPEELIIVDDASTDHGLSITREFLHHHTTEFGACRIQIIELPENKGPGHARNVGFAASSSTLVSFLDADDEYHPRLLEMAAEAFSRHELDFMVLNITFMPGREIYPDLDPLKQYIEPIAPDLYLIQDPLRAVSSPHFIMGVGSNVITRRKWINGHYYSAEAQLNEGIDFWYRVLKGIVNNVPGKIALQTGAYLYVNEVPGSLSRKNYTHFKQVELPPVISRYINSSDKHDRLLMGMIGERWYKHALQNLTSNHQKMCFVWYHRRFLKPYLGYLLLKMNFKS